MNRFFNFFGRTASDGKFVESKAAPALEEQTIAPPFDTDRVERIELFNVCYQNVTPEGYFGPVGLSLSGGDLVFVAGGNGAGRTTLVKLICGIHSPSQGDILFNGHLVTDTNRTAYRRLFSVVTAGHRGYTNEMIHLDIADDERLRWLLKTFHLEYKVQIMDGKISSVELSRTEKGRLALIEACLEDRPAYIFDEWAVGQDVVIKERFYYQILPQLKAGGKLILVVSQDDRYYEVADRLIKVEEGRIVEDRNV